MKFFKIFLIAAVSTALFFSCSKTDGTIGNSIGTLKSNDTTGDCLPLTVYGTYTAGVALTSDNYIDAWVNVTSVGMFSISTDSANGMSFSSISGQRFGVTGLNEVHLYSHGKPLVPGLTILTVQYDGTSCTVPIMVGGLPPGAFIMDTAGTGLTSAVVSGTYTAGVALSSADSVVMKIDVLKAGSIFLTSNSVNGITFSGTGVFTSPGIHSITLAGSGIPQAAGKFNFAVVDSLSDSTKFAVTVIAFGNGTPAAFSLGAGNGCSGFLQYGTYTAGIKLVASDSVTTSVTVTKGGSYSIVTAPVNGVVFSGTGKFDSAGTYTVSLKGLGTPASPGSYTYTAMGDSTTCTFGIGYGQGSAIYTLGSSSACTATINGVYKSDSALTTNSTVTLTVDVVTVGAYNISTPTVDGMTFAATGNFVTTGSQQVTLTGTGTPVSPGIYNFTIPSRAGSCSFTINVVPATAIFAFGTTPYGACTSFKANGNYVVGTALTSANTVSASVNVSYPGPYAITTTDTTDGIIFTAIGNFTTTGTQQVILHGSGKPTAAGGINFIVSGGFNINGAGNTCAFSFNVTGTGGTTGTPAAYTLTAGSGTACSGFSLAGNYTAGTVLTSANTATVQVNVTTAGTYTITTGAKVNGISFSASGTFTTTGTHTITLTGSGTPLAASASNYTATGGTSTCTFSVTPAAAAPPATFSLVISAGNCSGFLASGIYTTGTALTSADTVVAQVSVTAVGSYSITTATVNGISFSASGTFTKLGTQSVTLTGSGTPTTASSFNYTATGGGTSCTFSITAVQGTAPTGTITGTIGGTATTFNSNATATIDPQLGLIISGYISESTQPDEMLFGIDKTLGGTPAAGTYVNTTAAVTTGLYTVSATYTDNTNNMWSPASAFGAAFGGLPADPFTIVITSITATEVKGTFTGTVRSSSGTGTSTKVITSGTFDVPIQ